VRDEDFLEIVRHESRIEIDPRIVEPEPADVEPSGSLPEDSAPVEETVIVPEVIDVQELKPPPARLSLAAKERIRQAMPKGIDSVELERLAGGNLDLLPATSETTILSDLQRWKGAKKP
jgi:hypothetical protein